MSGCTESACGAGSHKGGGRWNGKKGKYLQGMEMGDCSESKALENEEMWVDSWTMEIFLHKCRNGLCCERAVRWMRVCLCPPAWRRERG
jgi:hypothetical protein